MTTIVRRPSPWPRVRAVLASALFVLVAVLLVVPVLWLLVTSLKLPTEYLSYPIRILPTVPQWENYVQALTRFPFWRYAWNTLVLALTFSTLTVLTSALAGFAFARIAAPGKKVLFTLIVALLIVPHIVTFIPQFVVFSQLKLTNTYWPWVLWGLGASPFHIFLFRQFFSAFPRDLEDAAEVDGCGTFRVFWQIFLPNALPAVATSFIFNFVWVWGDWFTPQVFLTDANTTLAVKLNSGYVDPQGNPLIPTTLAACVLYTLPLVVLFFLGQRYIVRGVVTTGLKG
jgi:ABC-type glycerol-3-phosphate transport system permease component